MSVISRPTAPKIDADASGGSYSIEDDNMDACYTAAHRYLGPVGTRSEPGVLFGYWAVSSYPPTVALRPTVR